MNLDWSLVGCSAVLILISYGLGRLTGAAAERRRLRKKFHEHSTAPRVPLRIQDLPDLDRFEDQSRSAEKRRHE